MTSPTVTSPTQASLRTTPVRTREPGGRGHSGWRTPACGVAAARRPATGGRRYSSRSPFPRGISVMIFSMICSTVMPSASALKLGMMRCRSTGGGDGLDVLDRHVQPAVHQRPGLAAEDQVLPGPRPGAPAQPVADEVAGARLVRAGGADQVQREVVDVVAHRHPADDLLQLDDRLGVDHLASPAAADAGGALQHLQLLVPLAGSSRSP